MTNTEFKNVPQYLANKISSDLKTMIADLDHYMTPYEKGEYLRTFMGEDTRLNYLSLRKEWRAVWDGFYPAEEFTRFFVDTCLSIISDEALQDHICINVYWGLKGKLKQLADAEWEAKAENFRARQREAKYFYTGNLH